jgi:Raf kinase inhibitor-like YbhB/YbcL family protein
LAACVACGGGNGKKATTSSTPPVTIQLTSPAFADNAPIPRQYTCDGANQPPPLAWSGLPSGTTSLALVMEDVDAHFLHWLVYGIEPSVSSLPSSVGAIETTNSFGKLGYGGPCPPAGATHHYVFTLYALPGKIGLPQGQPASKVRSNGIDRMPPRAQGRLTGTYKRGG